MHESQQHYHEQTTTETIVQRTHAATHRKETNPQQVHNPPQEYPSPVTFSLSVYVSVSFVSTVLQIHNRSCLDDTSRRHHYSHQNISL